MSDLIVVKYGSETVADTPGVDQDRLNGYARQLSKLSCGLIVVSSGSVMAGKAEAPEITDEQILAGLGSANIVMGWKNAFKEFGVRASQVPVTDHEIDDPEEGDTLKVALANDLAAAVVPIVNTNDKLSHKELDKRRWRGENDKLAAHIAALMGAGSLVLCTSKNGLYDDNGQTISTVQPDEQAHILSIPRFRKQDERGQGIPAKIDAAIMAANNGIHVHIAGADQDLTTVLAGQTGTHFVART